jgi:signal recognition particle subunit SRP54
MFEELSQKLNDTLQKLTGRGVLTEDAVKEGLREIRRILLEADVSFDLTREFLERVQAKAVGVSALKEVRPGQQIVKIVYDELVALLGEKQAPIAHATVPPTIVLLVGLQGSGKTTTAGKLAKRLKLEQKAPYLVAADVYRPAAIDQLQTLGRQIDVGVHADTTSRDVVKIVRQGIVEAGKARARTVIVDTAGRLQIDDQLMRELEDVRKTADPDEVLLVVDAMTGQDAVNVATGFQERVGLTGVVLSKLDGDARGGAAISVREVTGAPVKFAGVGEGLDDLEAFHPDRMASRILGMGDVMSLIEKAEATFDEAEAEKAAKKLQKGELTLEDFLGQLQAVKRMGPVKDILAMLPGSGSLLREADVDDRDLRRVEAIIQSMTPEERRSPKIIGGSRKRRIATGSGTRPQDVNRVLKQFGEAQKMMKMLSGGKGTPSLQGLLSAQRTKR